MATQTFEIYDVIIDDIDALKAISIQTFTETFAEQNSEADMQTYISEKLSIEKLSQELNSPYSGFYFLKSGETVLAYLKLNTGQAQTEKHHNNSLEIERIYVLKEYHSKGIGQLLLNRAIDIAKVNANNYIWLGVWEENHRAISFYVKNGFKTIDKHVFKLGDDEQTDLIMKLELI